MGTHFRNSRTTFGTTIAEMGDVGSKIGRTRKDGTTAYLAQILIKLKNKIVHRESQTFDRKQAAKAWLAHRKGDSPPFQPRRDVFQDRLDNVDVVIHAELIGHGQQ
jgi:hypothetical protein